jgi:transposase
MHTVPDGEVLVTLGVDTHGDVHVAVALDRLGGLLGSVQVPATRPGFRQLVEWASSFGIIDRIGIEGTGSYGAGLCRWLRSQGLAVVEVDRADRADRRKRGKDDLIDAENAARAVLAGRATGTPKSADGNVEMIRVLRVARRSAMRAKMVAVNQLHALIVAAPDELREQFAGLTPLKRARKAAGLRPGPNCTTVTAATKLALRTIARRYLTLKDEIEELDAQLACLVKRTAPRLSEQPGIGVPSAAPLLVTAGQGVWVVQEDGSKRLLGPYREASWSPRGLFVGVSKQHQLAAVTPKGDDRWTLSRARVHKPRWAPSGWAATSRRTTSMPGSSSDTTPSMVSATARVTDPSMRMLESSRNMLLMRWLQRSR